MMLTINIHQAKTNLSKLVETVMHGEEVIIAKAGKPAARLVPMGVIKSRKPGALKGKLTIANDFNKPLPDDILDAFEGR